MDKEIIIKVYEKWSDDVKKSVENLINDIGKDKTKEILNLLIADPRSGDKILEDNNLEIYGADFFVNYFIDTIVYGIGYDGLKKLLN